jgi:hypothetical protein
VFCLERIKAGYAGGIKSVEYVIDFEHVAQRALADLPVEAAVFTMHFLHGRDWHMCCCKLRLDRGEFFHAVYRVEKRLGVVYSTLKPYCLWPLREYFAGQRMYLREMDLQHTSAHPTGTRRFFYATAA